MGTWLGGQLVLLLVLPALLAACAEPPPPKPPPRPAPEVAKPAPEPPAAPPPKVDPPRHDCGQDPALESPIVEGKLGDGERMVRLINDGGVPIQARIVDESLAPALPGTLVVPPGGTGEFYVPAGIYMVRYRNGTSCAVHRGAKLLLTGNRAGVEIAIKPRFEQGQRSNMRKVEEPL